MKNLYCIRHGEALHNVLFPLIGEKVYLLYRDTPLTAIGVEQAQQLGESNFSWGTYKIDLIIVSPLLRTLQTMDNIFNKKDIPTIALDCVMEYPQGLDQCNHRKSINELKYCFPKVDFSHIEHDEEPFWKKYEIESIDSLEKRIEKMKEFINSRSEKNIAIVSHSSFLGKFLYNNIGNEQNELKHCYVYETKI
jgi:broad specificity phosphatase PhoE